MLGCLRTAGRWENEVLQWLSFSSAIFPCVVREESVLQTLGAAGVAQSLDSLALVVL